jgi:hypothetical protein
MEPDPNTSDQLRESKRLHAASQRLLENAKQHIETAAQRLDRTRNLLQLTVLLRALRERLRRH